MPNEDKPYLIGVDIGFGDVKVVANSHCNKFPTAIAYSDGGPEIGEESPPEYIFAGNTYLVGKPATFSLNTFPTRDLSFLFRFAPLLLFKALENVPLPDSSVHLAVGLPLAHFNQAAK